MNYYLDTEFIERPCTIDLVSIGIASANGRGFYRISDEFDESRASDWVRENVLAHLEGFRHPKEIIRKDILSFIGKDQNPVFWGYYADYDWVAFCWLFGSMVDLPGHFPMYCRDLKQELDRLGNPKIPFTPEDEHHALSDAKWNQRIHEWIRLQGGGAG